MSSDDSSPDDRVSKLVQHYQDAVDAGHTMDAKVTAFEILAAATEWCDQNPSADFDRTSAASDCEENADWAGAESVYQQVLLLPNLEPFVEAHAHLHLVALYCALHRDSDALRHAHLAMAAARRDDVSMLQAMTLQDAAQCLIRCDRIDAARAVVAETLAVIEDNKSCDPLRGRSLTLRAECAVRAGKLFGAERDLKEAFRLIRPMAGMDIAAGIQSALAQLWSVTAQLRAARDDWDGAVKAWQEAVTISRQVASLPRAESVYTKIAVADMLEGLADALSVRDRADDAATALAARTTILKAVGLRDEDAE